ncbi:MAG TPA: SH3 domain-containing protein [Turneriella sp.]|nr:SH3 domain-containing protein [Turneriella sp.]
MKVFLTAFLILTLVAACQKKPNSGDSSFYAIDATVGANVRETPGQTGKLLANLPLGSRINVFNLYGPVETIYGVTGHWCQVQAETVQGWVFCPLLRHSDMSLTKLPDEKFIKKIFEAFAKGGPQEVQKYTAGVFHYIEALQKLPLTAEQRELGKKDISADYLRILDEDRKISEQVYAQGKSENIDWNKATIVNTMVLQTQKSEIAGWWLHKQLGVQFKSNGVAYKLNLDVIEINGDKFFVRVSELLKQ